jgi:hypothetical protein
MTATQTKALPPQPQEDEPADLVWGNENIGKVIGRTAEQVSYLLNRTSYLDNVVTKVSHKLNVASRSGLRNLAKSEQHSSTD